MDNGIQAYISRREGEIRGKRDRVEQLNALIERDRRQTELLALDLRALTGEEGRAALRAQINSLDHGIAGMNKEKKVLMSEIEQRIVSESDAALIKRYAVAINGRVNNNPSYRQKREVFDLLDLRVQLRRDDQNRRWLDCTCGLRIEPDALPYDEDVSLPHRPTRCIHAVNG